MQLPTYTLDHTIIIEPGSSWLKINTASESTPKKLPHCIARRLKQNGKVARRYAVLGGGKLIADLERSSSLTCCLDGLATESIKDTMQIDPSVINWHPMSSSVHEPNIDNEIDSFLTFDKALAVSENIDFQLSWPLDRRFFRSDANYSSLLQDLEDLWTSALRDSFCISPNDLSSYRVILIIGDVFRHSEIRHLLDLLLTRLRFGHVLLHQDSVCTTYSLGLSTACIVNIGDTTTSVSCVDDGLSNPDSRVFLPIGRSAVTRTFHGLAVPWGFGLDGGEFADFDYNSASDVEDLRAWLQSLESSASSSLQKLLFQPTNISTNADSDVSSSDKTIVRVDSYLSWRRANRMANCLSLPVSLVYYANLLPFARIPWAANPYQSETFYECHSSLLDNPQPDDQFDDLYMNLTARDRRKRNQGQPTAVQTEPAVAPTDVVSEQIVPEPNVAGGKQPPDHVSPIPEACELNKRFDSLPNVIWWSINQCVSPTRDNTSDATSQVGLNQLAAEDLRKRLLKCIVLVGGGASGLASQLLNYFLTEELNKLVNKTSAENSVHPVEIITHQSAPDLVWVGARLLLTTEAINDLWISSTEWSKQGSSVMREKAPFIW